MYKLTVVAGPNRGTTYAVNEGQVSIGRQTGNDVVLQSARVSKRHCVLVVSNGEVLVRDEGSSNGTFVNGVLTRNRRVKAGDKISVGEFVLQLSSANVNAVAVPQGVAGLANVVPFPVPQTAGGRPSFGGAHAPGGGADAFTGIGAAEVAAPAPKDLKSRLIHGLETRLMPVFYGLTMKNEWRVVGSVVLGLFTIMSVVIAVTPLIETNETSIVREMGKRAKFMARQIADVNAQALAIRAETKTDIGLAESFDGVRIAVLTDLDQRIIAPSSKNGQHLVAGSEARAAAKAAAAFRAGKENGTITATDSLVVAIEPVKVFNSQTTRNMVIGMAIVSIDTTLSTMQMGEIGTVYSKALVLTGLLALLVGFILYRMTLKPLLVLNEDMDKVLKGDMPQVTHEFKFEELKPLWDLINSAAQRIPKSEGAGNAVAESQVNPDEYVPPILAFANSTKSALVVLDAQKKIIGMNEIFEEVSGIRKDRGMGQDIVSAATNQAMGAFLSDICDRASTGSEGATEDFEFSGIVYRITVSAFGKPGEPARCFGIFAVRNG